MVRFGAMSAILSVWLLATGCGKAPGYEKLADGWAWTGWNTGVGRYEKKLDADAATFKVLADPKYALDKSHVWHKWDALIDADPATFELLPDVYGKAGRVFGKDRYHVYLTHVRVIGADPATFRVVQGLFGADAKQVYCGTLPLPESDPATFEVLLDRGGYGARNWDFLVRSCDPAHLRIPKPQEGVAITLHGAWSRDAKRVYYEAHRVPSADRDTFRPIDSLAGADKNNQFKGRFTLAEFDAEAKRLL